MSTSFLNVSMMVEDIEFRASTWIKDARVNTHFKLSAQAGKASIWTSLDEDQTNALIDHLHMHIANIKKNEIELIAMNAEAKE